MQNYRNRAYVLSGSPLTMNPSLDPALFPLGIGTSQFQSWNWLQEWMQLLSLYHTCLFFFSLNN